ncbi:UNVERIFIED_CONTAM: hypothetical protein HDU68_011651 [Siphonaria sp. JEL0065]|nr:hypothetical protein HDU68_011651 [Siphonaria sp. JEL0065]
MTSNPKSRVSYALQPAQTTKHLSGVNALAIDFVHSKLFSGGRDANVNAWDLNIDFASLRDELDNNESLDAAPTSFATTPQHKFSATSHQISIPPRAASFSKTLNYSSFSAAPPLSMSPASASFLDSSPILKHDSLNSNDSPKLGISKASPIPRSASLAQNQSLLKNLVLEQQYQQRQPQHTKDRMDSLDSISENRPNAAYLDSGFSLPGAGSQKKSRSVSFFGSVNEDPTVTPPNKSRTSTSNGDFVGSSGSGNNGGSGGMVSSGIVNEYSNSHLREKSADGSNWSSKIQPTIHSRSFQAHSDWVNDVILCNRNQSIVTCSNDRMVYLWSTSQNNMYMRLGYHTDHVKCLAYSSSGGWVASGGLDRRVMIWDTMEGRDREIVGFSVSSAVFCHDKSPKASIYALACNPAGTTLVSGSPDKVVRVWDPRSGKQAIGLTGHRDNIRGLLVSDDGKWVVSASSDTTIKLWSLAHPQRCMVTYTHYEDSVWCLYSNHPDLDTFWAGGRDGLVTKMSRRRIGGDPKKGRMEDELVDCVAICKEDGPVHKLVAVDDMFVWTATDKSNINRWRDIPFRQAIVVSNRNTIPEESDNVYIPSASIIQQQRAVLGGGRKGMNANKEGAGTINDDGKLASGSAGGGLNNINSDAISRSASLISKDGYSFNNASKFSANLFGSSLADLQNDGILGDSDDDDDEVPVEPVWLKPDHVIEGGPGIARYALMNNRMHVVTEDTDGLVSLWDIVKCIKVKDFEAEDFKSACDLVNTFEWVANWCSIDTKNGYLTVHLDESKFYEAEVYYETVGSMPPSEDQRVNIGKWVLSYLFVSYMHVLRQQIPPAAVMYHDHYFGALTYTQLAAPPDSTSHYLFGQSVYYGPPDLVFLDSAQQQQHLQQVHQQQQQQQQNDGVSPLNPSFTSATDEQQQQQQPPPPQKSPNSSPTTGRKARLESLQAIANTGIFAGTTGASENVDQPPQNQTTSGNDREQQPSPSFAPTKEGSSVDGEAPAVQVRLRPRPLVATQRPESVIQVESALSHVQQIIKKPIPYSPNPDELPMIRIPPDVSLLVSVQETPEAACYLDQFRSTVGQIGWVREAMRLEEYMPRWVLDALTDKKLKDTPKMSFIMLPHPYSDLPELPNNANRLSSNRMIRLRKLLAYVAEQAKIAPPQTLVRAAMLVQKQQQQQQQQLAFPSAQKGILNASSGTAISSSLEERKPIPWNGTVNPGSVETLAPPANSNNQQPAAPTAPPVILSDNASTKSGVSSLFVRRKRSMTGGASVNSDSQAESVLLTEVNWKELVKPEEYLELCCHLPGQSRLRCLTLVFSQPLDPKMTLGTVKNLIWKSGGGDLTLTFRRKNV